jgi:hypothetical protein
VKLPQIQRILSKRSVEGTALQLLLATAVATELKVRGLPLNSKFDGVK